MMDKQALNKGFTMVEALLCLVLLGLFNFLVIPNQTNISHLDHLAVNDVSNKIINLQVESLIFREKTCLSENQVIAKFPICFNHSGNINMSQKIKVVNTKLAITIFLGAGKHEIK